MKFLNNLHKNDFFILFYKVNNKSDIIEKAISRWTHSKYYHTEIYFNNNRFGCIPENNHIICNKVSEIKLNKISKYFYTNDNIDALKINVNNNQVDIFLNIFNKYKNRKYDWIGIFLSQVFPLNVDSPKRFFCSEFICFILKKIKWCKIEKPCSWYHPGALFELISLNILKSL